jgi:hypothetical protein
VNGQWHSPDSRFNRQRLAWLMSIAANMCSSLDGQKYCSREYNQRCSSTENYCNCTLFDSQTPVTVLRSQPPKNLDHESEPSSGHRPLQELSIHRDPKPSSHVDDDRKDEHPPQEITISHDLKPLAEEERTAGDYVQLARTAITKGKIADAVELIEKGQTRLLDRSVDLDRTFDPITDESIQNLSAAKRALLTKDRAAALRLLDSALAAIK